ncbi:MAG: GIY-YIG nuclease family protein, partial [Holosporaceae bacterium]|nr:GIY-YIG nuclease family protein [Holosporaceae bacterium]
MLHLLFSKRNGTLYAGVINNLIRRIHEHKSKIADGFTKKYGVDKSGYFEVYEDITEAIKREKRLKHLGRKEKLRLIELMNPDWKDLYYSLL